MKAFLVSALALGALSSVALAEPARLTDTEMDKVTAAGFVSAGVPLTALAAFEGTLIPPLGRGFHPFVSPSGAIVVFRDGDLVSVSGTRRGIGFAAPTFRTFGTTPFTLIIVNKNVFAPAIAP